MKLNFLHSKKKITNNADLLGNIRRHWHWFLGILSVLFVFIIVFSFGFLGRLNQSNLEPTSSVVVGETIDRAQLNKVLKFFEDKATATEVLLKNPLTVIDPAL